MVLVVKNPDTLMFVFSGLRTKYEVEILTYGIALRKICWRMFIIQTFTRRPIKKKDWS